MPRCAWRQPCHRKRRRLKCDRDVKLHLPEALYDDLARQARADSRAVSKTTSASCWNGICTVRWAQGAAKIFMNRRTGGFMNTILADLTVSVTELQHNFADILKRADDAPIACSITTGPKLICCRLRITRN
ncbi:MAG: hypothetical protein U1F59_08995 [Candidatus Competibacteraceae bacterium]